MDAAQALDFLAKHVPSAFPGADTVLLAGSTAHGNATMSSDLDLVVLFPNLPDGAWRRTGQWDGVLVEAFVHDLETLGYFLEKMDRPAGLSVLANMIFEGVPVPGLPNAFMVDAKRMAEGYLRAGPPVLERAERDAWRYRITCLYDDLCDCTDAHERLATAAALYTRLAEFALRSENHFSGQGKGIARALEQERPDLAGEFAPAFSALLAGDIVPVQALVEKTLGPAGGMLTTEYTAKAPPEYRIPRQPSGHEG